ncbi:MAG: hypothetical protein MZV70_39250 [Desulfobacterales bacterium]|nr:hypothetical protein [Desulfobacterales bacterium]
MRQLLASQDGVALLIVLWVLTMLMVIVLSFSFMTRTETHATLTFREGIEKKFLAESGIQRAIHGNPLQERLQGPDGRSRRQGGVAY